MTLHIELSKHTAICFVIVLCGYLSVINNGYLAVILSGALFLIWIWLGFFVATSVEDFYDPLNSLKKQNMVIMPDTILNIFLFLYVSAFSTNIYFTAQNGYKVTAGLFLVGLIIGFICFFYFWLKINKLMREDHA